MSNTLPCKFFQIGRCTRGTNCTFSHSSSSGPPLSQGPSLPSGAMLPSMHGKLTKAAAEFWFPECRDCECCKGFKHGCPCCKGAMSSCSCVSPLAEEGGKHLSEPSLLAATLPSPPSQQQRHPVMINFPPGTHIVSIDVECAATSQSHNDRAVCSVGMVDEYGRPMLCLLVRPQEGDPAVLSYLTPLTGVRREDAEQHGQSLALVVAQVRALLTPHSVIVGQSIMKDVQWLGLREGEDFGSLVDLSTLFRVWNDRLQAFTCFSQDHVAKVWLNVQNRQSHDALQDAGIAMGLFNAYRRVQWDAQQLQCMQTLTLSAPRTPSFAAQHGSIDDCCLGHRKTCTCGANFAQS